MWTEHEPRDWNYYLERPVDNYQYVVLRYTYNSGDLWESFRSLFMTTLPVQVVTSLPDISRSYVLQTQSSPITSFAIALDYHIVPARLCRIVSASSNALSKRKTRRSRLYFH